MKQKLIINFTGSRASAFMTHWLLKNRSDEFEMKIVFTNTGKERNETLDFIQECSNHFKWNVIWIEADPKIDRNLGNSTRIVDYSTASRKGEPFEQLIQKFGIPNAAAPLCSRELKAYPIRSFAKSIGWSKYFTAIAIKSNESHSINLKLSKKEKIIYPLVSMIKATDKDIDLFWSKQPFDICLKNYEGNCDLCWSKSLRKLMTIVSNKPELADWWREMETKYGTLNPETKRRNQQLPIPKRFYKDFLSIDNIVEESKFDFKIYEEQEDYSADKSHRTFDEYLDQEYNPCAIFCTAT